MAERLTRSAWLAHGINVLQNEGSDGLRADKMVKALGVSRGSFYWHFANIEAFHFDIINIWRERRVRSLLAFLRTQSDGDINMAEMLAHFLPRDVQERQLDRAMRIWAATNTDVRAGVDQVDRLILRYLQHALVQNGISTERSALRARQVKWTAVGVLLDERGPAADARQFATIALEMVLAPERPIS